MVDARTATPAQLAAALSDMAAAPFRAMLQNGDAADLAGIRARHPDLAAKQDAAAHQAHARLVEALGAAEHDLGTAERLHNETASSASPLARQRTAEALLDAAVRHDELLLQIEASAASLPTPARK